LSHHDARAAAVRYSNLPDDAEGRSMGIPAWLDYLAIACLASATALLLDAVKQRLIYELRK